MSITMQTVLMIRTLFINAVVCVGQLLLLLLLLVVVMVVTLVLVFVPRQLPLVVQVLLLLAGKDGRADAEEAVEEDLCAADEAEAHAEAEQTSGVGNVRRLRDLLVLLESLGIGILDEDVEHDQVFFGVPEDDLLHGAGG